MYVNYKVKIFFQSLIKNIWANPNIFNQTLGTYTLYEILP